MKLLSSHAKNHKDGRKTKQYIIKITRRFLKIRLEWKKVAHAEFDIFHKTDFVIFNPISTRMVSF